MAGKGPKKISAPPKGGLGRGENADGGIGGDLGRRRTIRSTDGTSSHFKFSYRDTARKFSCQLLRGCRTNLRPSRRAARLMRMIGRTGGAARTNRYSRTLS